MSTAPPPPAPPATELSPNDWKQFSDGLMCMYDVTAYASKDPIVFPPNDYLVGEKRFLSQLQQHTAMQETSAATETPEEVDETKLVLTKCFEVYAKIKGLGNVDALASTIEAQTNQLEEIEREIQRLEKRERTLGNTVVLLSHVIAHGNVLNS
eukprot:PhF_6_TR9896/c0_g1_i1/m.15087